MGYRGEVEGEGQREDMMEWDPHEIARHAIKVTTIKEKLLYEKAL